MAWEAAMWAGIITGVAGAVSYAIKRYIDWKVDKGLAGQLEVLRKRHVERFNIIVRIEGMLAEIDHCMNHIKDNHIEYSQRCKDWCMKVRHEARASIALIGEDLVQYVTMSTDVALRYSDERSAELYALWKTHSSELHSMASMALKVLI